MKKRTFTLALSMIIASGVILGACGSSSDDKKSSDDKSSKDFTVAMVTDTGGVDDRSFNQSAWEGLQKFGKANDMEKGTDGYNYLQSASEADYKTNLNTAVRSDYDLIYGIGYKLKDAIEEVSKQKPKNQFAIVDDTIDDRDNVVSIGFKDNDGSYLVGVVAGLTTKTNKVGFVGGVKGTVIDRFEAGFTAGVKAVNPNAQIDVQYANDFAKADKGQQIASSMYSSGVDVIFHAAGGTGNGVFAEAKNLKKKDPSRAVWVIGVDRDQWDEGKVTANDGKDYNVTLTSEIKRVDIAVEDLATRAKAGDFPGGTKIEYGLDKDAVGLSEHQDNISKDVLAKVEEYKQKIVDGDIKVPEKP
ncbi:BMP family ABC transporter substrate-binding protein [Listeria monocytogenes]|uniref:BMP family lipoprotein n=1 Tax=Listeria monocytogenes TaxID=1639 RepID=UPI000BE10B5E|nr:BMP family protein [Listeria monocytogenes]PDA75307.1 BMP family ABC transporter substrate-binding protein [Listeria monocytogenes]PDA77228.1 BMP family ABC transporter substrate-binding protein [Listeria monocytogenes]PDC16379.1 BMP family ABC transporter substrate-binding protein [Listeria monocytogenes]